MKPNVAVGSSDERERDAWCLLGTGTKIRTYNSFFPHLSNHSLSLAQPPASTSLGCRTSKTMLPHRGALSEMGSLFWFKFKMYYPEQISTQQCPHKRREFRKTMSVLFQHKTRKILQGRAGKWIPNSHEYNTDKSKPCPYL